MRHKGAVEVGAEEPDWGGHEPANLGTDGSLAISFPAGLAEAGVGSRMH